MAVPDLFRRGVADLPREMVVQPRGLAVRIDVNFFRVANTKLRAGLKRLDWSRECV